MKTKLLPVLLILLILLNGALIFMLIKKTHKNKKYQPKRNFLAQQLKFSKPQEEKFIEFDSVHREAMMNIQKSIISKKDVLFNSFSKNNFNIDSLISIIGDLEAKKESEVFIFFKKVRSLCNADQEKKFDELITKAIKGGKPDLPKGGRMHPPNNGIRLPLK